MTKRKRSSNGDTTIRIPNRVLGRVDRLALMLEEVKEHEFFSSMHVVSNGFSRTVIIKWALMLGLQHLERERVRAVEELERNKCQLEWLESQLEEVLEIKQRGGSRS